MRTAQYIGLNSAAARRVAHLKKIGTDPHVSFGMFGEDMPGGIWQEMFLSEEDMQFDKWKANGHNPYKLMSIAYPKWFLYECTNCFFASGRLIDALAESACPSNINNDPTSCIGGGIYIAQFPGSSDPLSGWIITPLLL